MCEIGVSVHLHRSAVIQSSVRTRSSPCVHPLLSRCHKEGVLKVFAVRLPAGCRHVASGTVVPQCAVCFACTFMSQQRENCSQEQCGLCKVLLQSVLFGFSFTNIFECMPNDVLHQDFIESAYTLVEGDAQQAIAQRGRIQQRLKYIGKLQLTNIPSKGKEAERVTAKVSLLYLQSVGSNLKIC